MPKIRTAVCIVISAVCFSLSAVAWAGEIKVVDSLGLTRAVKAVSGKARIQVDVQGDASSSNIKLAHVDGLSPEILGERQGSNRFQFRDVADGTWQLRIEGKNVPVSKVSINP